MGEVLTALADECGTLGHRIGAAHRRRVDEYQLVRVNVIARAEEGGWRAAASSAPAASH
jgi:hypothetical protein